MLTFNLLSGHADNIPGNNNTNELYIPKEFWLMFWIAIAIFVIMLAIILYVYFSNRKTIKNLKEIAKNDLTDEERDLIIKYRNLDIHDKIIINETIAALKEHHPQDNLHAKE